MERNEISEHEIKIFRVFKKSPSKWMTNDDIVKATKIAARTIRFHTSRLVKLGILNQAEMFPRHRFKMSEFAGKRNKAYLQRLETIDGILE